MGDLRHAISRHMPGDNPRHVLPIAGDQLRKAVDLPLQHPVDNFKVIGHRRLHPKPAGPRRRPCPAIASYLTRE